MPSSRAVAMTRSARRSRSSCVRALPPRRSRHAWPPWHRPTGRFSLAPRSPPRTARIRPTHLPSSASRSTPGSWCSRRTTRVAAWWSKARSPAWRPRSERRCRCIGTAQRSSADGPGRSRCPRRSATWWTASSGSTSGRRRARSSGRPRRPRNPTRRFRSAKPMRFRTASREAVKRSRSSSSAAASRKPI